MLAPDIVRGRIEFEGIVQGVGFRPHLHKLAAELGLNGWVLNTSAGVLLELEGSEEQLQAYLRRVQDEAPPLARVLVARMRLLPAVGLQGFSIRPSRREEGELTLLCPDVATCADCLKELNNPADRRFRYPFINCTNCGPRYTIVRALPYDRPLTTMAAFPLCAACRAEYEDVGDRRYHAQPVACAKCGPRLRLVDPVGAELPGEPLCEAARLLNDGGVLALKGLGGFHLACRADNDEAVLTLRKRKRRSFFKPLAVMAPDLDTARELCEVDQVAEDWLTSPVSPVLLLPLRAGVVGSLLSAYVAPRLDRLGLMLPYAPVHHLLLNELNLPLVMTSGNLADEPIVADNERAVEGLGPLVDAVLLNDRPIQARCDDSVLNADATGNYTVFRHSRGFAPFPLALPEDAPPVLALGGDIKTTFAASRGRFAFLSPHLGDGEQLATYTFFRETWEHYRRLFALKPQAIACDLHPGYHTGRWAAELASEYGVELIKVQHHHAHLAALITEYNLDGPQLALVADGTGYGRDGTLWGGELLFGDAADCERVAHLKPLALPGGDGAVREPWRIALALLQAAAPDYIATYCDQLLSGELITICQRQLPDRIAETADPTYAQPSPQDVALVRGMLASGTGLVYSSALGRLLDGVSALLGLCTRTTYEGQAPMELEAVLPSDTTIDLESLLPSATGQLVDWTFLIRAILKSPQDIRRASLLTHAWAADAFLARALNHPTLANGGLLLATGGCLQNSRLAHLLRASCKQAGLRLLTPRDIPPGDGGLALGVLRVAQELILKD